MIAVCVSCWTFDIGWVAPDAFYARYPRVLMDRVKMDGTKRVTIPRKISGPKFPFPLI